MKVAKKIFSLVAEKFGTLFGMARLPEPINQKLATMKAKLFFVLFLIWNRAFVNYFRNIRVHYPNQIAGMFRNFSPGSWLKVPFMYIDTPEGVDYWNSISKKWNKFINNINL